MFFGKLSNVFENLKFFSKFTNFFKKIPNPENLGWRFPPNYDDCAVPVLVSETKKWNCVYEIDIHNNVVKWFSFVKGFFSVVICMSKNGDANLDSFYQERFFFHKKYSHLTETNLQCRISSEPAEECVKYIFYFYELIFHSRFSLVIPVMEFFENRNFNRIENLSLKSFVFHQKVYINSTGAEPHVFCDRNLAKIFITPHMCIYFVLYNITSCKAPRFLNYIF